MSKPLRVLIIEDSENDTLLIVRELEKGGFKPEYRRVETAEGMKGALAEENWDAIISDYKMPHFSGIKALEILNESKLDIPFILVSGTIGEELAVEAMKAGAADYVMKDNLPRLVPAIGRELGDLEVRRARRRSEETARHLAGEIQTVSKLAVEFSAVPPGVDIYELIAEKLKEISGALAVSISIYDGKNRELSVKSLHVSGELLSKLNSLLGHNIVGMKMKIPPEHEKQMITEGVKISSDLTESTFGAIPKPVAAIILKFFGIGEFAGLAFSYSGELMGTAVIFMPKGKHPPAIEVLHIFSNVAAVVLRRKMAEDQVKERTEKLVKSEAQLREAQGLAKVGNWEFDVTTGKIHWSDEVYAIFRRDKSLGPPSQEEEGTYYHPEQAKILRDYARRAIETGVEFRYDLKASIPGGKTGYFTAVMRPVKDESGKVVKLKGTVQDITDRKIMEDRLREREQRLRMITDNMLDLIIQVNLDEIVEYASPSHRAVLGYEPRDLVGKSMLNLVHSDDLNYAQERIQETLSKQSSGKVELRLKHADGHFIWFEISGNLIMGPDGEPVGAVLSSRDISEKKNADILLRESEEKYRLITENMSDVVWLMDFNLKPTYISPSVVRIGGYTLEELQALPLEKILIPASVEKVLEVMTEDLTPERLGDKGMTISKTMEIGFIRRNGTTFWADVTISIIRDAKGDPLSILCSGRDITERRKAQETIRMSEEKYRLMFDLSPAAIIILDTEGNITDINEFGMSIAGYSRDELIGKPFFDLKGMMNEEDLEKYVEVLPLVLEGKKIPPLEVRAKSRTGEMHWIEAYAGTLRKDGEITAIQVIAKEITDRKKAEDSLKESEEKYRTVFAMSPEAIILLDLEGNVLEINDFALNISGVKREDVVGKSFTKLAFVNEKDIERQVELLPALLAGEPVKSLETEVTSAGKGKRWIEASVSLLGKGDDVFAIQVIAEDITERKAREAELKRAMEELVMVNRDLRQFAYVASHDLQEPLRTVASFAQLLEKRYKGKLDPDADEFIAFMTEGVARMQNMINGLLSYSRLGTRGKPFQQVDCEKMLGSVVENMKASIEESGAAVTLDPLPQVTGDDSQLTMLFQNLISNSIKFHGKEPPKIHVSAKKQENEWVFSVSDNGIGIDPNYWERIFIIFQRLHTAQEYPGTGLGLAICKKIVERHGGRIWIESQVGKGTTIHFTIPFTPTRRIESI